MGALSPAQANQAILWFLVFLVALLVLSLAAVIASPLRTESAAVSEADGEPDPPGPEPPASPLPRRAAGQSGAGPAGGPAHPPGVVRPGGLPWGPAPKPPDVTPPVGTTCARRVPLVRPPRSGHDGPMADRYRSTARAWPWRWTGV